MISKDEFRKLCIDRYNALNEENDYKKGNRLESKLLDMEEKLILDNDGKKMLYELLLDEDDRVRFHAAAVLISIYTKECVTVFKEIQKNSKYLLSTDAKYALENYKEGNNYFENFLKENGKSKKK